MGNYKKGDKVTVKTLDWYDLNADRSGNVLLQSDDGSEAYFNKKMSKYCGKEATITSIEQIWSSIRGNYSYYYRINIDKKEFLWLDGMFIENNVNDQKKSDYSIWKFGDLFVIVNIKRKLIFPDFFITKEDAEHKLWEISK